ncbi:hypothetical protein M3I54_06125 [Paraburkholderia sp. CNPSo 3274]|uniref:hypothetical protein n=1 Tax=Paraburkholderia sp. CNPSo 3274 TaxID=2940932 RepID=UPI0020B6EFB7|nr:hypothetical protein [Paraburkholderia sp. CNPSo 3274]MCP3706565.1 hypothetical protein [Paraburkholderia sp. CNPSo 3274]
MLANRSLRIGDTISAGDIQGWMMCAPSGADFRRTLNLIEFPGDAAQLELGF